MKAATLWPCLLLLAAAPAEPSGYRMGDYSAPTPATLAGAAVLNTDQVNELRREQKAAFIDVLPRPPHPSGLPAGTVWRPKPRFDIPGSIWLPDTGYGALAPSMVTYFQHGLDTATEGNRAQQIVFYCKSECWMSWNAAKRAISLGYNHVAWYPAGTDGWTKRNLPTELREPIPRPDLTE